MQGKASVLAANLPSDLELLDAKVDLFSMQVSFVVRSDSFEDVAETMPIPELTLVNAAETQAVSKSVAAKVEFKPESGSSVARPVVPPVSRYAAKMENEFSPEQRKLLSFTVKDDCVVVKPVTFLKKRG